MEISTISSSIADIFRRSEKIVSGFIWQNYIFGYLDYVKYYL